MSYFSELLTFFSKRIGINSPQIAGYCNMDRVTVYRFMKGKTLPKDRETVSKMAEILQLTSEERYTLTEAYECTRLGKFTYWERHSIRSFIRSFSGVVPLMPIIQFDTSDVDDPQRETLIVSGRDHVIKRIQKEILRECEKPQCEISLIMSPGNNTIMDMLLSAGKTNNALTINHLLPVPTASYFEANATASLKNDHYFNDYYLTVNAADTSAFSEKTSAISAGALSKMTETIIFSDGAPSPKLKGNHELLQNLFKVIRMCTEGFNYNPSYYYTSQDEPSQFPVYSDILITEKTAVLFTDDLKESIVISAPDHVASFKDKYHNLADGKPSLFYLFRDVVTLIEFANKALIKQDKRTEDPEYYYSSLPCILPLLPPKTIEKHICREFIANAHDNTADVFKTIYDYIDAIRERYLNKTFNKISLLSESGIRSFIKTGRISDIPMELYTPLTEQERKQALLDFSGLPTLKFRVLKEELSAPEGMLSIEVMDDALFIVFLVPGKGLCFLYINEPGVLLAFRNFFNNLSREDFYSEEESREIVRRIALESE